jgi:hypothetical protein
MGNELESGTGLALDSVRHPWIEVAGNTAAARNLSGRPASMDMTISSEDSTMTTSDRQTLRKTYEQPELKVMAIELGAYGNYGDPGDHGPKPAPGFGWGATAG